MDPFTANNLGNFATAHSRGLIAIRQSMVFATAHSRGLRQYYRQYVQMLLPLPQRIRAGCDRLSSSTSMRVTIFATAHSRGLRPPPANRKNRIIHFATAHSCGLRRFQRCTRSVALVTLPQRIRAGCDPPAVSLSNASETLPQRIRAGCDCQAVRPCRKDTSLPQRIRAGCDDYERCGRCYEGNLCHSAFARVATAEKQCSALRICCEKVDSFSSVGESGLALTIFPFSFAAKATYVAINDSFGRAIDRFFGANRTGISISYDFAEHPCL